MSTGELRPADTAAFLFGFLLPISDAGAIQPALDAGKIGLLLTALALGRPSIQPSIIGFATLPSLILLAPLVSAVGWQPSLALLVPASAVGAVLGQRPARVTAMLRGFLVGASVSVAVMVAARAGLDHDSLPAAADQGLSFRRTALSYEAATAAAVAIAGFGRDGPLNKSLAGLLILGCLTSGGRGGLISLTVTLVALAYRSGLKRSLVSSAQLVVVVGLAFVATGSRLLTIERLFGGAYDENSASFSSGRGGLLEEVFDTTFSSTFFTGSGQLQLGSGLTPHNGVATALVVGGILGAAAASVWLVGASIQSVRALGSAEKRMLAAALLAMVGTAIAGNGPLFSPERLILFSATGAALLGTSRDLVHS